MATVSWHRSELRGSSAQFGRTKITSRIQSSYIGRESIIETIPTGHSLRSENRTAGSVDRADIASHHQTPTSEILSGN